MLRKYGLYLIWVLSCLGMLGSFYLGKPSFLDWCQRACLFPLIFMAGTAAWRGFLPIASYFIPQAFVGLCCALYQIALMKAPNWLPSLYVETVDHSLPPFVFLGVFLCIFSLSVYLSRRAAEV